MCTHTHTHMGTKTISIMDDAYTLLAKKKQKGESFSDVIRRLAGPRGDIMQFAGAWKNIPDEEIALMKKEILDLRKKSTQELAKRLKRL